MNVPEKLAREIARNVDLRARYAALDGMPRVNVKPVLATLDKAIEFGKLAAGEGDAVTQLCALRMLEAFKD